MLKLITLVLLLAMPISSIAQTEEKIIYITDNYHNRDCLGGTGFCRTSELIYSSFKTTASITKVSKNELEIILDKAGFKITEWEELLKDKVFSVSEKNYISLDNTIIKELELNSKAISIKPNIYSVVIKGDKAILLLDFDQI